MLPEHQSGFGPGKQVMILKNAGLMPHLGTATTKTRDAMGRSVLAGIGAILAGETLSNLVV